MMLHTYEAFREHAHAEAPNECCGLVLKVVGEELYCPCVNVSEYPLTEFRIREEDWVAAEDRGEILAVCHSHPTESAEPKGADRESIKEHGLPWYILGVGDILQRTDYAMEELEGRIFTYGWTDCYSLIRDYYLIERKVLLPDFPREDKFWETGESPYVLHFEACGFHVVPLEDLQVGDIMLVKLRTAVPNHAGVYAGNGRILHHLWGRMSTRDLYNGSLQSATSHVLRYHR